MDDDDEAADTWYDWDGEAGDFNNAQVHSVIMLNKNWIKWNKNKIARIYNLNFSLYINELMLYYIMLYYITTLCRAVIGWAFDISIYRWDIYRYIDMYRYNTYFFKRCLKATFIDPYCHFVLLFYPFLHLKVLLRSTTSLR